jgi:tRNA pseudouridine55 synthase
MSTGLPEPEGVLLVDKPQGITSHDVVDKVRWLYQTRRVGHAGTLDPMATGLLIILVGKATKASQYLMSQEKEYLGEATLGVVTDSQDADGATVETNAVPAFTREDLTAAMNAMLGDQQQIPPMHSAKKIGGKKLYELARQGVEVAREPRFIRIEAFELLSWESPRLNFRVHCTKGTYVRTIAYDLGRKLGPGAHLTMLRRTLSGSLKIDRAKTLMALGAMSREELLACLIPVHEAVPSIALG